MESNLGCFSFTAYQNVFMKTITLSESQDSVVPDTLPDIASIQFTSGCVLIRSKDVADGHIRLEANIPARVCCAGEEDGQSYCLDVNIPFYISAEDAAIRSDSVCVAGLKLKHLETRMPNPRKVSVRAEIIAELTCYAEVMETFCTVPQEEDGVVHLLEQTVEISSISCVTEKTFVLTDEFELPSDHDASEIVAQNACIYVQELRTIGSKLILKGIARSELLLRKESGEFESAKFQTEFSQIIETETETENALFEVPVLTSGMYFELTSDMSGKTVSMELHLAAQIVGYTQRQVRCIADAYSNSYALEIQRQHRETELYGREVVRRESFAAAVEAAGDIGSVIPCEIIPQSISHDEDAITVQLLARLCWRSGATICCAERMICKQIPQERGNEEIKVYGVTVLDVDAIPGNGGAELRINLELRGVAVQRTELEYISGIEYDETSPLDQDERPTLVIDYPRDSGDLWTLAKMNCSTVKAICAANGLSEEAWPAGRILLIPKTL